MKTLAFMDIFVKFFHILIAILALGTSAGLGIVIELFGDNPQHGHFMLRAIERIVGRNHHPVPHGLQAGNLIGHFCFGKNRTF
jgi:hypothetical protein